MRIAVVGCGYVGLVTGAGLASLGHEVACMDVDAARIATLSAGAVPIYEPGLAELIAEGVGRGRLTFTASLSEALAGAEAAFLCVGTPPRPQDGHADLSQVLAAAEAVAREADQGIVLVTKSTVPIGTGDRIAQIVSSVRPAGSITVASNPEFLREGAAIEDFMKPERIVVGVTDASAEKRLRAIYRPLEAEGVPLLVMERRTAELVKYAANCFLAIKVTYINEIARLCEDVGGDIQDVALGIGLDSRIGQRFLQAGPGFGGSCFPKDMLALIKTAQDHGSPLRSVETAVAVNDARKGEMVRKIVQAAGGSVAGKSIAVLGLTFKAETDDMRSAVSLVIVPRLQELGATIRAYDPAGMEAAKRLLPGVAMAPSLLEAARGADIAVILTEWQEFRQLDLAALAAALATPALVDLRNLFDPKEAAIAGLDYWSIGRAPARRRSGLNVIREPRLAGADRDHAERAKKAIAAAVRSPAESQATTLGAARATSDQKSRA